MPKTIEAIYENGVFKPLRKLKLTEHIRFKLTITPVGENEKEMGKIVAKQKKALLSIAKPVHENNLKKDPAYNLARWAVDAGIADLAHEHNHYLYGTSKTTEE